MSRPIPWLDGSVPPDVTTLTRDELIDVWTGNRNNLQGAMAADEMMKRLNAERNQQETNS